MKIPLTTEKLEELIDKRVDEKLQELGVIPKVPSGIVTVSGGMLTEETIERMKEFMELAKVNPDMSKILILEAEADNPHGDETRNNRIPINGGKMTPIVQLNEDGLTGRVISGNIDEIREMLKGSGVMLEDSDG